MASAPLQHDAIAFAGVLLDLVDREDPSAGFPSARNRLATASLAVVEEVVLAFRRQDPVPHLHAADDALAVARVHLSIALGLGFLSQDAHLALMDQADRIGRQIGALLRSLDRDAPALPRKRPRSASRKRLSEDRKRSSNLAGAPKP